MAIRTKEDLIDQIARDHSWRIREISEFKTLINSNNLSDIRKRVLARSGTALLYAHWEGFIKKSGSYFLEYISFQRLKLSELKSNFIALLVKAKIDSASESKKYSAFDEVTKYILENQNTRAKLPIKGVVDTKSNLSTNVLKEITWCLGIDYKHFEAREKLIDTKLVGRRNHIAHGEQIEIDPQEFEDFADEVLALMSTFKNLLENSIQLEEYKVA